MAKNPSVTEKSSGVTVKDTMNAPIIFFDGAPNFGNNDGIVNITLAAARHMSEGVGIASDVVAVAFLRSSVRTAIDFRNAIDQALLLGTPTPDTAKAVPCISQGTRHLAPL